MPQNNHRFKFAVLAYFFTLGANAGGMATPPGYDSTAPAPVYNPAPGVTLIAPGPPPPLQQEVIIAAPSPAHVWVPGYWNWQNRWIWIPGQWVMPPRPGARWEGHRWALHEDGIRYQMHHGKWR